MLPNWYNEYKIIIDESIEKYLEILRISNTFLIHNQYVLTIFIVNQTYSLRF